MEDFYIILPSNVPHKQIQNKSSHYITVLPHPIELEGEWRVAIVDFSFPNKWCNVFPDDYIEINFHGFDRASSPTNQPGKKPKVYDAVRLENSVRYMKKSRYVDIEDLINKLNHLIEDACKKSNSKLLAPWKATEKFPFLQYDKKSHRVLSISQTNLSAMIKANFSLGLKRLLGLESVVKLDEYEEQILKNQHHSDIYVEYGALPIDLDQGIRSLYVYSDIVDFSIVGDKQVQLLGIVDVPKKPYGEQIPIPFDHPHYQKLHNKSLHTIEIMVKDDSDNLIPFEGGETRVKLHLRRVDNGGILHEPIWKRTRWI